ncbi:MAG: hypothetical protein V3R96_03300 [Dehalococcoidales bacterium]
MATILSIQKTTEILANPHLLAVSGREMGKSYFSKPLQPGESLNEGPGKVNNRPGKKRRKRKVAWEAPNLIPPQQSSLKGE